MSLVGSWTYVQCSGVSSNTPLFLNATSVGLGIPVNIQSDTIPTIASFPNSELSYLGVSNRTISVKGVINADTVASNTISVSGLHQLATQAGSYGIWFYDETVFDNTSGTWVLPKRISINRNNDTSKSSYQVGYKIDYSIDFVETA